MPLHEHPGNWGEHPLKTVSLGQGQCSVIGVMVFSEGGRCYPIFTFSYQTSR